MLTEIMNDLLVGELFIYSYEKDKEHINKSKSLVKIEKVFDDERGIAQVSFLRVFVDESGNGLFNYLRDSHKTMNVSMKYLRKPTEEEKAGI